MEKLYKNRFALFFCSQLVILFGSLFSPPMFFEKNLISILFLINIAFGVLLISKIRILFWFYAVLFLTLLTIYGFDIIQQNQMKTNLPARFIAYLLFYATVSVSIIKQVWRAKKVSKNVIIGLMSGYISLGFIAFFMFSYIELYHTNSFDGIFFQSLSLVEKLDSLLYYGYITMLTIGYGDIFPVTSVAQKAAIFVGLMGQFYTVIITAVVVEKYIRYSVKE